MLRIITDWFEKRRQIRLRWQQDARATIEKYGRHAYYEAQRPAASSRAIRDRSGFWHWAKVASEVARLSSVAEMDMKVVQEIADEEMRKRRFPGECWRGKAFPLAGTALPAHPHQRGAPRNTPFRVRVRADLP